jgi:Domain of unknown function (DUF5658)
MTETATRTDALTTSLILFSYFQLLDLLTTVGFMMHGVREGNPLVRFALIAAPNPLVGLVLVKVIALGIGLYCWLRRRQQLLGRINVLFAALISWNMCALIVGSL